MLEIDDFLDAVKRVGKGGSAIDPEVIAQLFGRRRARDPLAELSPREREVLRTYGRGALQPRDLREARGQPEDRRNPRQRHLHQARPRAPPPTTTAASSPFSRSSALEALSRRNTALAG